MDRPSAFSVMVLANDSKEYDMLKYACEHDGIKVILAATVEQAVKEWEHYPTELIVVANKDKRHMEIVRRLREITIAFIFLISDRLDEEDYENALKGGYDFVWFRPYSLSLLPTQLKAIMKRCTGIAPTALPVLECAPVVLDTKQRIVRIGESEPVRLSQLECQLLWVLMYHPNQIFTPDELVEHVWGYTGEGNRDLVRQLIWRVRKKVEDNPKQPTYLHTIPQVGYKFEHSIN